MILANRSLPALRRPLAVAAIGLLLALGRPVPAQSPSLEMSGEKPIDVVAPGGFEFHEQQNVAIARGGATATQGDMTLKADTLAAYFRKNAQGTNEIYRLLAEGNVELHGDSQTAYGGRGIYDLDRSVAVLTGEGLRLVTEQDTVTATDSLEYWRTENLAVARGNAVAIRENNRVRADRLVGLMGTDAQNKQSLSRVDANGNVIITTPQEVARGDKGTYDLDSEMALLTGNVKVTRGQNQLNGPAAQVDLKSGVSRMLSQVPSGSPVQGSTQQPTGDGRVRGLFIPDSQGRGGTPQQPSTPPSAGQQAQPGQGSSRP